LQEDGFEGVISV